MRADNADLRLTAKGYEAGIVSEERLGFTVAREAAVSQVCGGVEGEGGQETFLARIGKPSGTSEHIS